MSECGREEGGWDDRVDQIAVHPLEMSFLHAEVMMNADAMMKMYDNG